MKPHSEIVRKDLIVPKRRFASMKARVGTSSTVCQEVKDWLKVMIRNHWYLYENSGNLYIAFHNHNDAMKYKLVWH